MAIVVEDVIDGAQLSEGPDGLTGTRVFIVSDLNANPPLRLAEALKATPARGTIWPGMASILLDSKDVRPEQGDNSVARVTCTYKPPKPQGQPGQKAQIEAGSSLSTITTNLDIKSELIQIKQFNDPTTKKPRPAKSGTVQKQIPQTVFRLSRTEKESPQSKSTQYVGRMNSASFLGGDKKTWLCTNLSGRSGDGGNTYNVTYEFQFNKDTWDAMVAYIDPDTDLPVFGTKPPPIGKDASDGWKRVVIYETADFNALGLI